MEKKSLGRGLEDISRAFMTPEEGSKPGESSPIFSSTSIREESCLACINMVDRPLDLLKCKVFCFKNEEYGVPALESIMPGYAKYCRYFKLLTACEADNDEESFIEKIDGDDMQYTMEVEETINRQKKIVFKDDGNLQNNFKKMLSQHLEMGYEITRIDLEKKEEHKDPTCRIKTHEKVTISRKDPL